VLLCADEDDLDLVGVVRTARQRGLVLEVVSGIDSSDEPMLYAMQRTTPGLFVLVKTEHLASARALALKTQFSDARVSEQHLMALRLDPERIDETVETIRRRLERLDRNGDGDLYGGYGRPPDSLDPSYTPLIDREELMTADPDRTEQRKVAAASHEEETTRSIVQYYKSPEGQSRPRRPLVLAAMAGVALFAVTAAAYVAWMQLAAPDPPPVNTGATGDEPEVEPQFDPSGAAVPTVDPPAASEKPQKPRLRRRTTRRRSQ
jgi:hypothetical protein